MIAPYRICLIGSETSRSVRRLVSTVRISARVLPGVQVINVSALEKGNYLLRVTDQESSNRDMLEQLIKN